MIASLPVHHLTIFYHVRWYRKKKRELGALKKKKTLLLYSFFALWFFSFWVFFSS